MRPLGLLGGAFDPVHVGHLRLALEALERLALERVLFIPLAGGLHRQPPIAPAPLRVAMLAGAIAGEPRFAVDTREIERGGTSYTVDTLVALRAELGQRPLVWLLGLDAFAGLPGWHRWTELRELAHFAVAMRPGTRLPDTGPLAQWLERARTDDPAALAASPAGRVCMLDAPPLDLAASGVRALVAAGRSIRYLVPDTVGAIIRSTGVYRHAT